MDEVTGAEEEGGWVDVDVDGGAEGGRGGKIRRVFA